MQVEAVEGRNLVRCMSKGSYVAASFSSLSNATAAVDWFRNQAIDANDIIIAAVPPGGEPRAPQRGDNQRTDITWIVALDLEKAAIPRSVAADTLRREGGKSLSRIPRLPAEKT